MRSMKARNYRTTVSSTSPYSYSATEAFTSYHAFIFNLYLFFFSCFPHSFFFSIEKLKNVLILNLSLSRSFVS